MVYTYYEIGKRIFLEEQNGKERASYGEELLKKLSKKLTAEFGNGFSEDNLKLMRRFYLVYSVDKIGEPLVTEFKNYPLSSDGRIFFLSWTLYLKLMRIDNIDERHFMKLSHIAISGAISGVNREELEEPEKIILNALGNNPHLTAREVSGTFNIHFRSVQRYVSNLREKGFIERIGANKNGYWKIIK